jgi:hypothetical protein
MGTAAESQLGNGMVLVDLRITLEGPALTALDIRLEGQPLAGGGVAMTSSGVTLGTTVEPGVYSGKVTDLAGTSLRASLGGSRGSLVLLARLRIDPTTNKITGTVTVTPPPAGP